MAPFNNITKVGSLEKTTNQQGVSRYSLIREDQSMRTPVIEVSILALAIVLSACHQKPIEAPASESKITEPELVQVGTEIYCDSESKLTNSAKLYADDKDNHRVRMGFTNLGKACDPNTFKVQTQLGPVAAK